MSIQREMMSFEMALELLCGRYRLNRERSLFQAVGLEVARSDYGVESESVASVHLQGSSGSKSIPTAAAAVSQCD